MRLNVFKIEEFPKLLTKNPSRTSHAMVIPDMEDINDDTINPSIT